MRKLFFLVITCAVVLSGCKTVIFTASESDAKILINGQSRGTGSTDAVRTSRKNGTNVKVQKQGFFDYEQTYYYSGLRFKPLVKYITLTKDDSYEASVQNDNANKDFEQEVSSKYTEDAAWKIIGQIVTSYFDDLEITDKFTGYLKTGWKIQTFSKIAVRTRVIVKQSGSEPLKYKIKIISEYADDPKENVRNDDKFKEWSRVLKKYDLLISEFQTRLGNK